MEKNQLKIKIQLRKNQRVSLLTIPVSRRSRRVPAVDHRRTNRGAVRSNIYDAGSNLRSNGIDIIGALDHLLLVLASFL